MSYMNRKDFSFIESFASAMICSRKGVLNEYALLLRFQQGTQAFRRQCQQSADTTGEYTGGMLRPIGLGRLPIEHIEFHLIGRSIIF